MKKNMKGKFIVLDGTDGSGKGTQTELLHKALQAKGHDVLLVDFPQYGQKSAALVEEYLNGRFGGADEVSAYQASIFYACDRFAAKKQKSVLKYRYLRKILYLSTDIYKNTIQGKIEPPEFPVKEFSR